jgi:hypothetical protein
LAAVATEAFMGIESSSLDKLEGELAAPASRVAVPRNRGRRGGRRAGEALVAVAEVVVARGRSVDVA